MLKLLVAEDVRTVREAIVYAVDWNAIGVRIVAAVDNGEEALRVLEEAEPDIVLTDIGMPRMNGIELIAAVKERRPNVKCIILSGLSDFEYARQALKLYVLDYVLKPIDPEEIQAAVQRAAAMVNKEREERRGLALAEQAVKEKLPKLSEQMNSIDFSGNPKKKKVAEQTLEYVLQHFRSRELTLTQIAAAVGLSEKYLNLVFKEVTGHTLNHFIIRLRMEEAARLLQDPIMKVYEVCDLIGYSDQDYFRESFKKHYGVTPTEYKSNYL
ncbi:response regulator transcription factor [Paenibacillus silviterrae]|uniref:response regulator transcription factor n=1 Tax=Paenibacillus silviterrae TaxID=3242194 RepID=UPI0025433C37|nr:response regulator [Paenibacillus chinjuensis]